MQATNQAQSRYNSLVSVKDNLGNAYHWLRTSASTGLHPTLTISNFSRFSTAWRNNSDCDEQFYQIQAIQLQIIVFTTVNMRMVVFFVNIPQWKMNDKWTTAVKIQVH